MMKPMRWASRFLPRGDGGDVKWNKENVAAYLKGVSSGDLQRNTALFASFVDGPKRA
jgi:hypothetical protein